MRTWTLVFVAIASTALSGCGYNSLQQQDENVKAAWGEVLNQYQRRADLIPNLVNTVKGFAIQEQQVLIGVTEARAKVGSIQATPELVNNPEAFQKFEAAQGELTQALKSLFAVTEAYPQRTSAICRRRSRARRIASPWPATATSMRCAITTSPYAPSRRTSPQSSLVLP